MDAVDAALLDAVRALLLAEAGGIARHRLGQLALGQDLVDVAADHGVLGRADQIEVLALDLVHHRVHLREGHDALDDRAVDEKRRDHEIARIGQHRLVQAGDIAHQIVEAVAGDAARRVKIDAVEGLHDLGVIRDREIGRHGLAEALHLDVAAVVRADRHGIVDDLRDAQHNLADLRLILLLELLKLGQTLGLRVDLRLDGLDLVQLGGILLRHAHELADLLGEAVALRAQVGGLADCRAVQLIQLDDLVHEGQLFLLELLLHVLPHEVGIFSYQSNIDHSV